MIYNYSLKSGFLILSTIRVIYLFYFDQKVTDPVVVFRNPAAGKASEREETTAADPSNWLAKSSSRKSRVCFLCTKPSGRHTCMLCFL